MELDACVRGLRAGGRARERAVRWLYDHFGPRLRARLRGRGVTIVQDREDILQETLVRVCRHIDQLKEDAAFAGWFWIIAQRALVDQVRSRSRELPLEDLGLDVEGLLQAAAGEPAEPGLDRCVREALAAFGASHPQRLGPLLQASLEGWSMDELATALKRTAGATRQYVHECRRLFRTVLGQLCRDYLPLAGREP